ncbi:helix-turn-helix domain-containing protein [Aliarcobacter butzleri]|uniref:helix-turn-helix domain-containing protein n=1 Tax=Aliarcobacter butzleri TaxID=28197 RepID=UPI003AF6A38E
MSVKAINQAFDTKLNGNVKLVLLALADSCNDDFECFPSYSHISRKASVSLSTSKRVVEKLVKLNFLEKKTRKKRNSKENTSNLYKLTIEKGSVNMKLHKNQNDTTVVSSVTPQGSVIAMTLKPSLSLNITQSLENERDEREFLNFKNDIVNRYQNKKFKIANEKFEINEKGMLCINKRILSKNEAFDKWDYIYKNSSYIQDLKKYVKIDENQFEVIKEIDNFYVIEFENKKVQVQKDEVVVTYA